MDWGVAATVFSAVVVGGGGLAFGIYQYVQAQKQTRQRDERARSPDIEVRITGWSNWANENRTVTVWVINHWEHPVYVIDVGVREVRPSTRGQLLIPRPDPRLPVRMPRSWSIRQNQRADLPKEIRPKDGMPFNVPTPLTPPPAELSVSAALATRWSQPTSRYLRLMGGGQSPRTPFSIQAWVTTSTQDTFYSPTTPAETRRVRTRQPLRTPQGRPRRQVPRSKG